MTARSVLCSRGVLEFARGKLPGKRCWGGAGVYPATNETYRAETRLLCARRVPLAVLMALVPLLCFSAIEHWYYPERPAVLASTVLVYAIACMIQIVLVRRWPAVSVTVTVLVVNGLELGLCGSFGAVSGSAAVLLISLVLLVNGVAVLYPWGVSAQLAASAGALLGYPAALALGATRTVPLPLDALALLTAVGVAGLGAYVLDAHRFTTFRQATASRALLDVAQSLDATLRDPDALARQLADRVRHALGADWVTLSQKDLETGVLHVTGVGQVPEGVADEMRSVDLSVEIAPDVYRLLQQDGSVEIRAEDMGNPLRGALLRRWNLAVVLLQAVKREHELIGMINCCYTDRGRSFDPRERELLAAIAKQAGVAFENARLIEDAQRANRAKSEFIATVSHELRTPVSVIMGYADLLLDGTCDPADDEGKGLLRRMRQQAGELSDLVQGLLDVSRMETHRLALDVTNFSVGDLVADVSGSLPAGWRKDGVALHWEIRDNGTILRSDRRKAAMILRNLVHNALKYTVAGSVTVAVERSEDEPRIVLTITDTGPGIPLYEQAAIFEMFRQSASVPRNGDGVGLGLYIVKRLTESIGGQVAVDSTEGIGSRFTVSVPVEAPFGTPMDAGLRVR